MNQQSGSTVVQGADARCSGIGIGIAPWQRVQHLQPDVSRQALYLDVSDAPIYT